MFADTCLLTQRYTYVSNYHISVNERFRSHKDVHLSGTVISLRAEDVRTRTVSRARRVSERHSLSHTYIYVRKNHISVSERCSLTHRCICVRHHDKFCTKRALFSTKRALLSTKRALYSTKRFFDSTKRALYFMYLCRAL